MSNHCFQCKKSRCVLLVISTFTAAVLLPSMKVSANEAIFQSQTLRQGARGPAVEYLQGLLAQSGLNVQVDGSFGPGTSKAVREFQASRGLSPDGVVGARTWAALTQRDAPPVFTDRVSQSPARLPPDVVMAPSDAVTDAITNAPLKALQRDIAVLKAEVEALKQENAKHRARINELMQPGATRGRTAQWITKANWNRVDDSALVRVWALP